MVTYDLSTDHLLATAVQHVATELPDVLQHCAQAGFRQREHHAVRSVPGLSLDSERPHTLYWRGRDSEQHGRCSQGPQVQMHWLEQLAVWPCWVDGLCCSGAPGAVPLSSADFHTAGAPSFNARSCDRATEIASASSHRTFIDATACSPGKS